MLPPQAVPHTRPGHPPSPASPLPGALSRGPVGQPPDSGPRGRADPLAARRGAWAEDFRDANPAVRGKLLRRTTRERVEAAAMGADPVALVGGLDDALQPRCGPVRVRALPEQPAAKSAPGCGRPVPMRSPGRRGPVLERYRGRREHLYAAVGALAEKHGALVVDLYASKSPGDLRLWTDGRLRLPAEGRRRVAEAV